MFERGREGHLLETVAKTIITLDTNQAKSLSEGVPAIDPEKIPLGPITAPAKEALITVEGGAIRVWTDGSTPTTTEGHLFVPGQLIRIYGISDLKRARFIRVEPVTVRLMVTIFR